MMETKDVVSAVRKVVGVRLGDVPLHVPSVRNEEIQEMNLCDPIGHDAIDAFQAEIAKVCGVEHSLCVSSGTAALHLALLVTGVEPFHEVLVPALTFVGTANAVTYCGAIPNFVDVRDADFGINPFKLQRYLMRIAEKRKEGTYNKVTGRKISALIAVDLLGMPCAIDEICAEASGRWGIPVIEDSAEALGSSYKGTMCGNGASIGIISFNANKIVTTGQGGALLTNDAFVQANAWELSTTARLAHPWLWGNHTRKAWNYRMANINAALGLSQLRRIKDLIRLKEKVYNAYCDAFSIAARQPADVIWNYWINHISLGPLDHRRDEICAALTADGISCRTMFTPLNELPMFKSCPRDNADAARDIWRSTICLPSSPYLGENL